MPHTVGPLQRRQLFSLVWDGLRRISRKYGEDGCAFMAAAIAFYAFFGIFPFILFAVAAAAHVLDPAVLRFELMRAGELYLPGSESLVRTNVDRLVAVRGQMGLVAVLGVFWASSGVFGALRLALNRIWRRRQRPSVIWRKLQDLSITAVLVILLAGSAVSRTVLDAVAGSMDGPIMAWVTGTSALVVPLIATTLLFAMAYRVIPNVSPRWPAVAAGGLVAASGFELVRNAFVWYVVTLSPYQLVYGSLGAVIALLFWIYLSVAVFLLGAQVAETVDYFLAGGPEPAE